MRLYRTAADHLSYRPYQVYCAEAAATLPALVADGTISPIYETLNPHQESLASKTIVDLAELHASKISFVIVNDRDVLMIAGEIEAYLAQTKEMPQTEELRLFLKKILPLREQIHRLQKRVFKRRPDWASKFHGLDSGFIALLYQFMRGAGINVDTAADPLEVVRQHDQRILGSHAQPMSLQDQLSAADEKKRIAELYEKNPGQLYDSGM